jgi:hypothetical protein
VQLHEGAKPVKAPLPRYSAEQAKKEQHHIKSAMDMGHLITPEPEDIGPWATATHVVFKKDSDWGRLICDFRALNKATIPMPISISDVRDQVRNVAQKLWKSLFDALHGFNQISASKSARKLLQIQSSLGLKQWSVMPFGVINGPSVYQNMMQQVFAKYMSGTDEKWQTLDSSLSFFMDDGCLGTGDIDLCKNLNEGNKSFERHIEALDLVMSCARGHRLRFKLSKCSFAQWEIPLLGMVASVGQVKPDPKKQEAILLWPRPSRREDVERLLATVSFLRQHLDPRYSSITKPLRDVLSVLHEKRSLGFKTKRHMKGTEITGGKPDDPWPEWWTQEAEHAFIMVKDMVSRAVALATPDHEGARTGRNPFRLFMDACKYAVGGGLFQLPKDEGQGDSHYTVLGVPTWATKVDIERAYNKTKRQQKQRTTTDEDVKAVEVAFEILSNTESRKAYDVEMGKGLG